MGPDYYSQPALRGGPGSWTESYLAALLASLQSGKKIVQSLNTGAG